jgi:5-dehydro-2-deoxygluconokinase
VTYDLITVGRVNMDLFAQDIGVAFADVTGFDASVGGSPTNVAIAAARLGLSTLAFTGVGDDAVGDWIVRSLGDEGVCAEHVHRKPGHPTSLALVGVRPPGDFPLSFYRQDPADIHLTVDDADALPWTAARAVLLSGNAFSRGTCADAARRCAQRIADGGPEGFLDLDLRPADWSHPHAFGLALRPVLPQVDVVLGTEEEWYAALAGDPADVATGATLGDDRRGALDALVNTAVADGTVVTAVVKRGSRGVTVHNRDGSSDVDGFAVEVVNTVGAGDAFAAGLIRSRLHGLGWYDATRFANACGAVEVTRHGCSVAFPTADEVVALMED